jgi:glyceraldehyde-3-phosphate dehydrogenase (NADP+)
MVLAATKPHPIYLAGDWVESSDVLEVTNPADAERSPGATYSATAEQYESAVQAAVDAFDVTRKLPAYERGRALREISAGLTARREEIGALMTAEIGKLTADSILEVDRTALTFRLAAEEAERMTGEVIPLDLIASSKGRIGITRRFPIGPVAGISPFNLPLGLSAHKLAPAIATGCPIVLKPPSAAPLSVLAMTEVIDAAGLPRGALSVLPMSRELGDRLVED